MGEPAPELDRWLARRGAARWAWVTAVNPGSVPLDEAENRTRLARLEAHLRESGLELERGEGIDPEGRWPAEPSFLVVGATEAEGVEIAAAFGQAACLAGELGSPPRLVFVADGDGGSRRRHPRARSAGGR